MADAGGPEATAEAMGGQAAPSNSTDGLNQGRVPATPSYSYQPHLAHLFKAFGGLYGEYEPPPEASSLDESGHSEHSFSDLDPPPPAESQVAAPAQHEASVAAGDGPQAGTVRAADVPAPPHQTTAAEDDKAETQVPLKRVQRGEVPVVLRLLGPEYGNIVYKDIGPARRRRRRAAMRQLLRSPEYHQMRLNLRMMLVCPRLSSI